jgi:hypothetical protein
MQKIVNPKDNTYCQIRIDGGELSICGVVNATEDGNADTCGQIQPIEGGALKEGWTEDKLAEFNAVWDKWHLNHMKAGTPEQHRYLDTLPDQPLVDWYDWACDELKKVDLYEVQRDGNPYRFGSAWLRHTLPQDVIDFLADLPEAQDHPAWI